MDVSSTSMKVASMTDTATSHGLIPVLESLALTARNSLIHPDTGRHRHPRAEQMAGPHRLIQNDFHRHALHHFHIIPRRVFGRHQAEARPRTRLDAVHMAVERCLRISIHLYLDRLAGPH